MAFASRPLDPMGVHWICCRIPDEVLRTAELLIVRPIDEAFRSQHTSPIQRQGQGIMRTFVGCEPIDN